jgi:hypothetical protein
LFDISNSKLAKEKVFFYSLSSKFERVQNRARRLRVDARWLVAMVTGIAEAPLWRQYQVVTYLTA